MTHNSTAILVFSRVPYTEIKYKNLSGRPVDDLKVYQHLFQQTLEVVNNTDLPSFLITDKDQVGNSFGEKITHAISEVFSKGFENIIIVGSDCPNLGRRHLLSAHRKLAEGNQIIAGPDKRGGVFLLGINRKAFDGESFLHFSWQTGGLYRDVKNYAGTFSFDSLTTLHDIHSKEDVLASTGFSSSESWNRLVGQLFGKLSLLYISFSNLLRFLITIKALPLRAPPLYRFS